MILSKLTKKRLAIIYGKKRFTWKLYNEFLRDSLEKLFEKANEAGYSVGIKIV